MSGQGSEGKSKENELQGHNYKELCEGERGPHRARPPRTGSRSSTMSHGICCCVWVDASQAITKCFSQGTHRCIQISDKWCALSSILHTVVYAVYCVVQLLCAVPANHGSRGFLSESEHGPMLTLATNWSLHADQAWTRSHNNSCSTKRWKTVLITMYDVLHNLIRFSFLPFGNQTQGLEGIVCPYSWSLSTTLTGSAVAKASCKSN